MRCTSFLRIRTKLFSSDRGYFSRALGCGARRVPACTLRRKLSPPFGMWLALNPGGVAS